METGIRDSGFGSSRATSREIRSDAAPARADVHPDLRTRQRVIVERVWPEIDGGRFPIKRAVGEPVTVSADIFADGQDVLAGVVRYRRVPAGRPSPGDQRSAGPAPRTSNDSRTDPADADWQEVFLIPRDNDRWEGTFTVSELGDYE